MIPKPKKSKGTPRRYMGSGVPSPPDPRLTAASSRIPGPKATTRPPPKGPSLKGPKSPVHAKDDDSTQHHRVKKSKDSASASEARAGSSKAGSKGKVLRESDVVESPTNLEDTDDWEMQFVASGSFVNWRSRSATPELFAGPMAEEDMRKQIREVARLPQYATDLSELPGISMSPLSARVSAGKAPSMAVSVPAPEIFTTRDTELFLRQTLVQMKTFREMLTRASIFENWFVKYWKAASKKDSVTKKRVNVHLPPQGSDDDTDLTITYSFAREFAMQVARVLCRKSIIVQYNNWMDEKMGHPGNWKNYPLDPIDPKTGLRQRKVPKFPFRLRGAYPNWFERLCDDDANEGLQQQYGKEKYED